MINLKLIYKIIGSLLFIEAMMLVVCLGVSVYYHEDDLLAFASSIAISAGYCDSLHATATTTSRAATPTLWLH